MWRLGRRSWILRTILFIALILNGKPMAWADVDLKEPDQKALTSMTSQMMQKHLQMDLHLNRLRQAYGTARSFLALYPGDRNIQYTMALIQKRLHHLSQSLITVKQMLKGNSESLRFRILEEHEYSRAREVLLGLYQEHQNNPHVLADLLDAFRFSGLLAQTYNFDEHLFSQGETQPPVQPETSKLASLLPGSLRSQNFAILYSGGAAYVFDAKLVTPLFYGDTNFFTGRTEFLGLAAGSGNGTNDFTYAGVQWHLGDGFQATVEAGDTRLHESPGFYGHVTENVGRVALDVQAYDNMIWGDFGQSIIQDGIQSGVLVSGSATILPRLNATVEYWWFSYALQGGQIPFGELHNTIGFLDYNINSDPQIDMVVGYDSWNLLTANPVLAASIPMLPKQRYFLATLTFQQQYRDLWHLDGEIGGYDDFYLNVSSLEGSLGLSYQVSPHLEVYGSGNYFQESTFYVGASEEFTLGFNVIF